MVHCSTLGVALYVYLIGPPGFSIHGKMIVATWLSSFSLACQYSCRPPDPVQTQLPSIPVQQADAESPEKQSKIQVMQTCQPFCLHAWAMGSECLENVSDAWNSVTDLKFKGI